jgi:hypothetical protein
MIPMLRQFKWYRRLVGGRWEKWMHEEPYSDWYQWDTDSRGSRPNMGCRGTPLIEVYD